MTSTSNYEIIINIANKNFNLTIKKLKTIKFIVHRFYLHHQDASISFDHICSLSTVKISSSSLKLTVSSAYATQTSAQYSTISKGFPISLCKHMEMKNVLKIS
jgi:hypothetical protein